MMTLFRPVISLALGLVFSTSLAALAELRLPVDAKQFAAGEEIFLRQWVASTGAGKADEGLGPLFNAPSCVACHINNGRGRSPEAGLDDPSLLLRLSIPPQNEADRLALAMEQKSLIGEPLYGQQLQPRATGKMRGEGRVKTTFRDKIYTYDDGKKVVLHRPSYSFAGLNFGAMHKDVQISPRIAQPLFGLGLIAKIPEAQILALEDANDENGDNISGRANRVRDLLTDKTVLGRFGWKATEPNLKQQIAGAFAHDMGISSPLFPQTATGCEEKKQNCVTATHRRAKAQNTDIDMLGLDQLTAYISGLPALARRKAHLAGEQLFDQTGCSGCHRPSFEIQINDAAGKDQAHIVHPYSDLLLHDMGAGLADHRGVAQASGWEWRTQPLWGIGRAKEINGNAVYLHDGRARSIEEAILWHGGEARKSRAKFSRLNKVQRGKLIDFVRGL